MFIEPAEIENTTLFLFIGIGLRGWVQIYDVCLISIRDSEFHSEREISDYTGFTIVSGFSHIWLYQQMKLVQCKLIEIYLFTHIWIVYIFIGLYRDCYSSNDWICA